MTTARYHSLEQIDNARFKRTATKSVFHKLDCLGAVLTVAKDHVIALRSNDAEYAIGVQDLGRYCCFILMGTTSRPAIIMAQISTSDGEEHYMSLVPLMIGIFIKEQESFQNPRVWSIFGHSHRNDPQIDLLTQRTTRVFQHLDVRFEILFQASPLAETVHPLHNRFTVVAVRHEPESPEIYVENCLLYPNVHLGSLALVYEKLGFRQIDHEHGGATESGREGQTMEAKGTVPRQTQANGEKASFSSRESILATRLSTT